MMKSKKIFNQSIPARISIFINENQKITLIKNYTKLNHFVTNARNVDQNNEQMFTKRTLKRQRKSSIFFSIKFFTDVVSE
jgi:hypothetical protein